MKSVIGERPNFISLGHPTVETADIRNIDFATSTRAKRLNGVQRGTERDDILGYTHDFETMSKTIAYRNHIKDSEIETRENFERETSTHENIQRTLATDIHKPEVNPDPEPSLSDSSSETYSSDSRVKKKKRKKKKKRRKHQKADSSYPSSSDDSDSSHDSHYRYKRFYKGEEVNPTLERILIHFILDDL